MSNKNFDSCVSFHINGGAFAGRLVRLNDTLQSIIGRHCYPLNVSAALAETTALAILLSSSLKYNGLFTLQIQGDGPVSLIAADVTSEGKVRACAKFDNEKLNNAKTLRKTEDIIEEVPHLVGGGHMAFTIDQGPDTELYQGVIDLQGKTLTELALRYFKQSDQIDTILKLFLKHPEGDSLTWQSAGIMLQKVPVKGGKEQNLDEQERAQIWNDAEVFINSLGDNEIFDADLTSAEILNRLFHANDLYIGKEVSYQFGCRCSREKLATTLSGFSAEDLDDMTEDGNITATCNFCSENYVFDRQELKGQPSADQTKQASQNEVLN